MSFLAVLLVFAAPPQPRLLGPDAPDTAEKRYRIGRELYRAAKYDEAAREFMVVLQLMPDSPRITFNVARSLERAGRHDEALTRYQRYLELAPEAEDRAEVEGIIRALEQVLAGQAGRLEIDSAPPATVYVDDREHGTTPIAVSLEPGAHVVRLEAAGRRAVRREITVEARVRQQIRVELEPLPVETGTPPWVGWTAVGVGGVGLLAGTLFLADAAATTDEAEGTGPADRARRAELQDDLDRDNLGMWVSYGVGAALVGAGVYLLLDDAPDEAGVAGIGPGVVWGRF